MFFDNFMTVSNKYAKQKQLILIGCFLMAFAMTDSFAAINAFDRAVDHPPIPILDEQGNHVLETHKPYSPKKTCAGSGCHDYEGITHAYHFEMGRDEANDKYGAKRGLPQLVSPGYYGGYTCMQGNNPQVLAKKVNKSSADFADLGSAGWVKSCMSCHAGGGWAEKDRDGIRYDEKKLADIKPWDGDYYERMINPQTGEKEIALWDWKKSGVGEADCLFCHVRFSKLKLPEDSGLSKALSPRKARVALVEQGFFRQAASGLMEYVQNTDGKNLLSIARSDEQFSLDEEGLPILNWHADAFTETGRVVLSMLRFPENKNCMECHLTSNSRRGFYGFGEEAKQTLATDGGDEVAGGGGTIEDDYRDDVHKGTNYIADNGEKRSIESCNSCHASQYFKPETANIDLDADHNFPKGNSDMDVRNDLDYSPNVRSCEECHINSINAVVGAKYDSLLHSHTELWKESGDLNGYDDASLTPITQTHFDVVSCQTCHIVDKTDGNGKAFQMMYRFRIAEDGQSKISPYNPRLRYYWQDKTSGHILIKTERDAIFDHAEDANVATITDPLSGEALGSVSVARGKSGLIYLESDFIYGDPATYADFKAVKKAYDNLLRKKGYNNPDVNMVWSESNEYVISHNTRATEEAMPCADCHEREANGVISQQVSAQGILGSSNSRVVARIPDIRLVSEGIVSIGLPYSKLQANGTITQNVADILQESSVDPFMSLLKNSSASEITGKFIKSSATSILEAADPDLVEFLAPQFTHPDSFIFQASKGDLSLRNMLVAVNSSIANNILLPTFRVSLGMLIGAEKPAQSLLDERSFGALRSRVFYFDVVDQQKNQQAQINDAVMLMKVAYKGIQTDLDNINIVIANIQGERIRMLPENDLVHIQPATVLEEGYVIFKIRETGYFLVADK